MEQTKMSFSDDSDDASDEQDDNDGVQLLEQRYPLIPDKSKRLYEFQYQKFVEWREQMNASSDQSSLMSYFIELSKIYKPPTLWTTYSKLRSTILLKENIDIRSYFELQGFLKKKSKNYKAKKAKVFTHQEVSKFLNEAPNREYLASKVILIVGIYGCLRSKEILSLTVDNIKQQGLLFHMTIPITKGGSSKSFVTSEKVYPIIKEYMELRPAPIDIKRFFIHYQNGKCSRQPIGKNKIAAIPQEIATYLNLPNVEEYTGHTFRRTSAAMLADKGVDLISFNSLGNFDSFYINQNNSSNSFNNSFDSSISSSYNNSRNKLLFSNSFSNETNKEENSSYNGFQFLSVKLEEPKNDADENMSSLSYDPLQGQTEENSGEDASVFLPPAPECANSNEEDEKKNEELQLGAQRDWTAVENSLIYARTLREEADAAAETAFAKFHQFLKDYGPAAKEEAGVWVVNVKDEEEEKAALIQLRKRRNEKREAELQRARDAEKRVERLRAELAAQKRLAKKREEDLQRQLLNAEREITRAEKYGLRTRPSPSQHTCIVCNTPGVRHEWECPNRSTH